MTSDAPPPPPKRRSRTRASAAAGAGATRAVTVRKPVNTLAIVPKSARITSLGRKSYNVLLHEAQAQGLDKDVFRAPLERIVRGVDFDSNDHALIKKHLRAMVSTTVEWQSPTTGEGTAWNVSGLLAHARLTKERGQVWVEWSYAVNLKQELLEPSVFARLKLEIISQLRSHAGIALYEICTRYKDVGRTSRQHWRWWRPVLSGQPESERTAKLEYRIFKRDTLKPAIAELNALTDLQVELAEYKDGRFIGDIQFLIKVKPQAVLPATAAPQPVDLQLVARAQALGVAEEKTEQFLQAYGPAAVQAALELLARRSASNYPEPLRDPARYLKAILAGEPAAGPEPAEPPAAAAPAAPPYATEPAPGPAVAAAPMAVLPAEVLTGDSLVKPSARRQARWVEAWLRRRRERVVDDIAALSDEAQAVLCEQLLADMEARQVHPSIRKRLQTSGWQHPLVLPEMVRWFAQGVHGPGWDQPTPQQLLEIAAELGDG
ncbi:replication initiation protein [Azohydromonas australica]|uniref:replication initiation protein n=1 Tax=Azohydromonas australica TaxID=364039 RepID=UPI0006840F2B|nr:replication initiation protein [Azohydromonas australica]